MNTKEQLRNDIETALGRKLQSPKDFEFFSERIYARLHIRHADAYSFFSASRSGHLLEGSSVLMGDDK